MRVVLVDLSAHEAHEVLRLRQGGRVALGQVVGDPRHIRDGQLERAAGLKHADPFGEDGLHLPKAKMLQQVAGAYLADAAIGIICQWVSLRAAAPIDVDISGQFVPPAAEIEFDGVHVFGSEFGVRSSKFGDPAVVGSS